MAILMALMVLLLSPAVWGAQFIVTNTNSSGAGSLPQAVMDANGSPGPHTIHFDIPGCGTVCTIRPESTLSLTGGNTTIDGYSQPGSTRATATSPATLKIEIRGNLITNNHCFGITSSGNTVKGLIINQCSANGVYISGSGATGNRVSGNFIGTNFVGLTDVPNTFSGVFLDNGAQGNTVGGGDVFDRNLISGNRWSGVEITDPGTDHNIVSGNYIGTFASGNNALPNIRNGIHIRNGAQHNIIGGDTPGTGNVISGNQVGLWIGTSGGNSLGHAVKGNYIGTDVLGLAPIGNTQNGVHISVNTLGNFIGPNNTIAYNGGDGVGVDTPTAQSNFITRNRIFANGGRGIHLTNGANGGITPPVIEGTASGSIRIGVATCGECAVQVFSSRAPDGEGEIYLGGGPADGAGHYVLEVSGLPHPYLTATATDARGTSEFSAPFTSTAYLLHLPLILR